MPPGLFQKVFFGLFTSRKHGKTVVWYHPPGGPKKRSPNNDPIADSHESKPFKAQSIFGTEIGSTIVFLMMG
jgi:hypothetical protein